MENQKTHRLTSAELAAKQNELEAQTRAELAPVDAEYWAAVKETNLLHEQMKPFYEAYRAMWEEKVVPHRAARNNIYRKYRRRMKKLEEGMMRY